MRHVTDRACANKEQAHKISTGSTSRLRFRLRSLPRCFLHLCRSLPRRFLRCFPRRLCRLGTFRGLAL